MGSQPSRNHNTLSTAENGRSTIVRSPYDIHGNPIPPVASIAPEDTQNWYVHFWEKAFCVPHEDGKSIIVFMPVDDWDCLDPRVRAGWATIRLRQAYELLGEDHPRIVRYIAPIYSDAGNGVIIEKLTPGAHWGGLPVMTTPILHPDLQSREDRLMLSLYYRWALQSLSALALLHSKTVNIKYFTQDNVWLRSDYSVAITGFISACAPEIEKQFRKDGKAEANKRSKKEREHETRRNGTTVEESSSAEEEESDDEEKHCGAWPWDEGEWAGRGNVFYDDVVPHTPGYEASVHEDLFYWATFVWELMTNDHTTGVRGLQDWSPFSPVEGGSQPEKTHPEKGSLGCKDWHDDLQVLEEERLGSVLLKAWKGEYESAEQAAEDVRKTAEKVGIKVVGVDEVDVGEKWEDVFEMVKDDEWKRGSRMVFSQKEKAGEKGREHEEVKENVNVNERNEEKV